jgi:hypothetical protein
MEISSEHKINAIFFEYTFFYFKNNVEKKGKIPNSVQERERERER